LFLISIWVFCSHNIYTTTSKVPARASSRDGNRNGRGEAFCSARNEGNKKNCSNCMTILFGVDTVSSSNGFQICIWFQKICYTSTGPRKTHPMAGPHPWWCAINCWLMVPVPSWKKLMVGYEVVFYFRFDDHAWKFFIRKDIEWDEVDIHLDHWLLFNEQIYFVFLNKQT